MPRIDGVPNHLPLELRWFGYPGSTHTTAAASGEHPSWPQRTHAEPPSPPPDPTEQNADSEFAIGRVVNLLRMTHASHIRRRGLTGSTNRWDGRVKQFHIMEHRSLSWQTEYTAILRFRHIKLMCICHVSSDKCHWMVVHEWRNMGNTGRASMMTARGFRDSAFFHLHQEEAIDAQDEAEWNIVLSLSGRFAARALLAEPPSLPSPSPARVTVPPSF